MAQLTPTDIRGLLTHLVRWLTNLRRAGEERKRQSVEALRDVIVAVRKTSVYLRESSSSGGKDARQEEQLAELWTRLSFRLEDLGLTKLAKRCHIRGQHWANPDQYSADFLKQADVSLESIERLARLTIAELRS